MTNANSNSLNYLIRSATFKELATQLISECSATKLQSRTFYKKLRTDVKSILKTICQTKPKDNSDTDLLLAWSIFFGENRIKDENAFSEWSTYFSPLLKNAPENKRHEVLTQAVTAMLLHPQFLLF